MLADGIGDLDRFAVVQRVVAAHDALQLGELPDHAGHEVCFRQLRRALGHRAGGADVRGDDCGETFQPDDPVALRAELGLEGDMRQRGHPAFQPPLAVEVPEMPRIREPGAQHPFVAGDDSGAAVLGRDVGHEGEPGGGFALGRA